MSCIAGLIHLGGERVAPSQLDPLMAAMRPRAPDGELRFSDGSVALGYLHLRTGHSAAERMPVHTADDALFLVADARIDGRRDLAARLKPGGLALADDAPHAHWIRAAYQAWGDALCPQLLGDFAFLLWDRRRQVLLAGRDIFGVRPLHYARSGELLAFASDADALLALPGVSRELDECSLADFLLFGSLQEAERSIFRAIRCIPPAARARAQGTRLEVQRYWSLPTEARTRLPSRQAYVEAFAASFDEAVADRLPGGPVAIQLSGGMDSSSIAAVAARRTPQPRLAVNATCKSLVPDDVEGELAAATAAHLGMHWFQQDIGRHGLFDHAGEPPLRTATPVLYPKLDAYAESLQAVERFGARVLLSGHGGDALFAPSPGVLQQGGAALRVLADALHHRRLAGTWRGLGLRRWLHPHWPELQVPDMPDWMDPGFAAKADAAARWQRGWATYNGGTDARHQLQAGWLVRYFETAETLKRPLQLRHPFYDRRVVELLLGFPDAMLANKRVLREAMAGALPPAILARPKQGLAQNTLWLEVTNGKLAHVLDRWGEKLPVPILQERYLMALDRYTRGPQGESTWSNVPVLSPLAYAIWAGTIDQGVAA